MEKEIKSKANDRSNKVNLKSFKNKYLTLKKKTSAIHKEHGTDSDYILIIKNNLQKPGGKNCSPTAGKYLVMAEGSMRQQFLENGIKFDVEGFAMMKNDKNMEVEVIDDDNEEGDEEENEDVE